ncbi:prenyltransferase [Cryptosporangium phraense]|uniref:Prenyltransferase n=1 Tax=Cryptosporangium phraense TaxID=2593070 RepID=A0A545AL50_9ACTN|nr:prenyltransferase [Cryptosporangium phraense]TQS42042.1 prenyltransferase [Cryptosporangium phraense]
MSDVPALEGVLTSSEVLRTAEAIAEVQEPAGAIPWFRDGHLDPWDHVQSAMALTAAGLTGRAEAAYEWCRQTQRPDGSWASKYVAGRVEDASADANFTAYVATGVWHHWTITRDRAFVERMWPVVRAAIGAVLSLQTSGGEIHWGREPSGAVKPEILLTGNASVHLSLRCAVALAEVVGELAPEWELAAARLGHVVERHPERFADKHRYSMDWYYPILSGVLSRADADARLAARWDDFVVPGLGIRCVADQPWVTGAETCELVLALDAIGRPDDAREQLAAMQHLRHDDGSYWTGYVYPDATRWPVEQTAWTAATVILATDALSRTTPGSGLFRGEGLPSGVLAGALEGTCSCPANR